MSPSRYRVFSSRGQKYESAILLHNDAIVAVEVGVLIVLVIAEKCISTRVSDRNGKSIVLLCKKWRDGILAAIFRETVLQGLPYQISL